MTRTELAKKIYDVAYLKGEFLLRSGKISNEYFDKYQFESSPLLLKSIVKEFTPIISKLDFDYLAALEMGGIPIATAISLEINEDVVFVRKKAKEYGTQKFAEGPNVAGKKLLIVEDVITSGGQVILSKNQLQSEGAIINDVICVIDRESGGKELLKENNLNLYSLFTMSEIKKLIL
jgi:orotate phosphoribosyltransferase